ncbi:hypothetical protein [Flavobacterium ginsengiterrae]|uniref:Uncharacterized protein n=1 Tax=Flavobacterium ginsengiterrae TaxID=871695 RepID=A0ABP7GSP1_9FLAO
MGTIKTGFWKLAFIITPDEFKQFIEYVIDLNIYPEYAIGLNIYRDRETIYEQYEIFYSALISKTKPSNYMKCDNISFIDLRSFVCKLRPENSIGFIINPANMVHWLYNDGAVRISDWAVQITLQKGVSLNVENSQGKYFVYEDIKLHSPQSYPLYQKLTYYIKSITKPLRFNAQGVEAIEEVKPPVRISKQAADDFGDSWLFTEFKFKMKSYI